MPALGRDDIRSRVREWLHDSAALPWKTTGMI